MTIYDRLLGKKFDAIKDALTELGKHFAKVMLDTENEYGAVIQVTGSFDQVQAFEPKFVWNPVVPEGVDDPKAHVHWTTVLGLRRDPRSKKLRYIF